MLRFFYTVAACALMLWMTGCAREQLADIERSERSGTLYRRAIAAEQAGDVEEAIRLLHKVLLDEPRSFSAHFQLATLLQDRQEDYLGAIYHYKQYLAMRPESEKSTLANDRIRVAEQLLAPQILRRVGDSVEGISQAHLLKEKDRLNHALTDLEGEKSALLEEQAQHVRELERLKQDNERLRTLLRKLRVNDDEPAKAAATTRMERTPTETSAPRTDSKTLKALRSEAEELAQQGGRKPPPLRRPAVDLPSTESVLKRVEEKLASEPSSEPTSAPEPALGAKPQQQERSAMSLLGRRKQTRESPPAPARTYVVQPGDTLFRVAERFYGDSTQWKRIREANRANINPDGRIRAGQIITIP